jgi:hypothetical protein
MRQQPRNDTVKGTESADDTGSAGLSYDKMTGADVGAVEMPDKQTGSPMTYLINRKQYIASR